MSLPKMMKEMKTPLQEQTGAFTILKSSILKLIDKIKGGTIDIEAGHSSSTNNQVTKKTS